MSPLVASRTNEPIAGYTLRERIGAGGYGEVWKAEAPGGLSKAIKFVYGQLTDERAECELKALHRIKEVRHPFLLSLERIEIIDGQLVIITELAEMSLKDRFDKCREQGLPGIPRDELLVYLGDAADALDYMSENFSLQHLDVKPENLLIVGNRVKVADFGLVREIENQTVSLMGGLTPVYAPPESFHGHPTRFSDQYSLAIVYQEMLTGVLPFPGKTTVQLTSQHLHSRPRLNALPPADRLVIARGLNKDPNERFPSSRVMTETLKTAGRAVEKNTVPGADAAGPQDPRGDTAAVGSAKKSTSSRARPDSGSKARGDSGRSGSWGGANPPTLKTLPLDEATGQRPPSGSAPVPTVVLGPDQVAAADDYEEDEESLEDLFPAAQVVDLPPIEIGSQKPRLRPTVFVGIGGTAGRTLRRLRRRLQERLGNLAAVPAVEMLLLDTDLNAINHATQGEQEGGLKGYQTLGLPLRPPQDYREESDRLLQWLSRRWLYNIPRSLQTEGVRPLGRLAFVDHAKELFKRLRTSLGSATTPEALEASAKAIGVEETEPTPRVFVLASISGGTGSGMVLDAAYAVRVILDDLGLSDEGLAGLLIHSTVRNPNAKELALANACACLSELQHYARAGYPGDPACDLPAFGPERPTFRDGYLVHLGDDLSEEQFEKAVDSLAEYLYLDTVTAGGRFLDACRQSAEPSAPGELNLRSFGLGQAGFAQSDIPTAAAEILCKNLVQRWCGDGDWQRDQKLPLLAQKSDAQPAVQAGHPLQLSLDQLLKQVLKIIEGELGGEAEAHFRSAVEKLALGADGLSALQILDAINSILGDRSGPTEIGSPPPGRLQTALGTQLKEVANTQGTSLCNWLHELVDTSSCRVEGAHLAAQWVSERLRTLEGEADGTIRHQAVRLSQLEQSLLETATVQRARSKGWLGIGRSQKKGPAIDERWQEYFRLRLDQIVLRGVVALTRSIRARISAISDELADLRRKLFILSDQFDSVPFWTKEDGNELPFAANTPTDPYQSVAEILHCCIGDLAMALDREFQAKVLGKRGGLKQLLQDEGDLHGPLPARLRSMARAAVNSALKQIDLAEVFFRTSSQSEAESPLKAWLDAAMPRLAPCGGSRRLLLVCPEGSGQGTLHQLVQQSTGQVPSLAFDADVNLVLCCEMEDIPLVRAAAAVLGKHPECAQVAARLHTRIDVAWSPLSVEKRLSQ